MAHFEHDLKKFCFSRAPKSGVVTRAYLNDQSQADFDADAIDKEFEAKGSPTGDWEPSVRESATKLEADDFRENCSVYSVPLINETFEQVGVAFASVDGNCLNDLVSEKEIAVGQVACAEPPIPKR